jgi:FMN phosphatase YigB (HAD superfamily)
MRYLVKPKENSIMIGDSLDADVQGALDGAWRYFFNEKKKPYWESCYK